MSTESTISKEFSLLDPSVENGLTVEASAGSGKTYSVAGVVAAQLAIHPDLRISEILVTTFTRNAAAELKDRVRRQLVSLERSLRENTIAPGDTLAQSLAETDRISRAHRLDVAIREFDSATISTIHSVCSRVMAMAGLPVVGEGRTSADISDTIANVVNAVVVSYVTQHGVDKISDVHQLTGRMNVAVKAALSSPRSLLLVNQNVNEVDDHLSQKFGENVRRLIRECVERVNALTEGDPTFDDLLLRTAEILGPNGDAAVSDAFRARFKMAIIDEAQDTDQLQWEIFRSAFGAQEVDRKLITVGDPKQAIYRFRGADVEAYLTQRDITKVRTLTRNWRSDGRLIRALNSVFNGKEFGENIAYVTVAARDGAPETSIDSFPSLSVLNIGVQTQAQSVVTPAAFRVHELLQNLRISHKEGSLRPKDICVLVSSRTNGRKIEIALRKLNIPAVSSGTESVMASVMASDLRRVMEAMASLGNESRIRLAAATVFLGAQLTNVGAVTDKDLENFGQLLFSWNGILHRKGINSLAFELRRNSAVVKRIVEGRDGERRETDLAHIIELLHDETGGKGCTPEVVLEAMDRLAAFEDTAETVSRRVESDRDAVQIMTVHASKGLEFPVVVVADLWKLTKSGGKPSIPFFHNPVDDDSGVKHRLIDVGWVVDSVDNGGTSARKVEESSEQKRLFYVAMTRAKHHVSLIHTQAKTATDKRVTTTLLDDIQTETDPLCIEIRDYTQLKTPAQYVMSSGPQAPLKTSKFSRSLDQTYQRLSFSGLTKHHRGQTLTPVDSIDTAGGGAEDDDQIITLRAGYSSVESGVSEMPLGQLTGGTYFGKVMHKVYELINFSADDLSSEVTAVIDNVVVGALAKHKADLVRGVVLSLQTPLGGPFGEIQLCNIAQTDRLAELSFEMGLASLEAKVTVAEIGAVLQQCLRDAGREDDILMQYANSVEQSFKSQLVGLMNGSIDALLRVVSGGEERYFISDYKTNRLDLDGVEHMIDGYSREAMLEEMEHHDYPLQALIYGVSVYRYLRWARPEVDAGSAVAGLAYFFVRGMVGIETPVDGDHRHGVFTWEAPPGLWKRLSDLFSGGKS